MANNKAGRGRAHKILATVQDFLTSARLDYKSHQTQSVDHALDVLKTLPPNAKILVVGGDGTVHTIASACVNSHRSIAIIPAGSGDDFAYGLGIPRNDVQAALQIALHGQLKKVDTGVVNGHTFINAFGVGFDAEVAHKVQQAPYYLKERSAYLYAIVQTLNQLQTPIVNITIDDKTVFEGPSLLVSSQNGPRTGGSFLFAPEAKLDDGLCHVVIAGQFTRLGALRMLPQLIKGKLQHPNVSIYKGKEVKLTWQVARSSHMEGELLTAQKTFHISIKEKSLSVFRP